MEPLNVPSSSGIYSGWNKETKSVRKETNNKHLQFLTHWPLRDVKEILKISNHMIQIKFLHTSCEMALRWMPQNTSVNIGSENGLVSSGTKSSYCITSNSTVCSTACLLDNEANIKALHDWAFLRGPRWIPLIYRASNAGSVAMSCRQYSLCFLQTVDGFTDEEAADEREEHQEKDGRQL